jgi:hypothetical protein
MVDFTYAAEEAASTSNYDHGLAHNVEIKTVRITNHAGEKVDVKEIFIEMNIFNSIFESNIYGNILLTDTHSILTRLPIIGEETIEIEYNTPGNVTKNFKGVIYNVRDIIPDGKGAKSSYVLNFCSEEALANAATYVAKSYRNTLTADEIVKDVLKTYLQSDKTINVDACMDPAKVLCIPYLRPYDAIEFLQKRVKSKDTEEDFFLFFERFDGVYFKNFAGIISSPLNKEDNYYIYISDKFGNQRDAGLDMRRILSLKINSKFDTIQKIYEGMLNNESFEYSFDDKYVYSNVTSYKDVNPYIANEKMNTKDFIEKYSRGEAMGLSGNMTSFKERRVDQNFNFVKPTGKHLINKLMLNQISITITVPGDSTVDVGDIITLKVPEFTSDEGEVKDDPHLSGRYIIGSVRNIFLSPDKHSMQIDLYKDGFNEKIKSMDSKLKDELL